MCRGKALQWAALPLIVALVHHAHGAAVHRAEGVDEATARLLGSGSNMAPVISRAPTSPESSDPGQFFAPDSWRPVWRDLSERRSALGPAAISGPSSGEPITEELLMTGPRQLWPQARDHAGTVEVVITPKPLLVPDLPKSNRQELHQEQPEVAEGFAALASQLLASGPDMPVLDIRTPPRLQQLHAVPEPTSHTPVKAEDGTWSLITTTHNEPLRISEKPSTKVPAMMAEKPITKIPAMAMLSENKPITKVPSLSTMKSQPTTEEPSSAGISTRFPPRKPSPEVTTKKSPMVEIPMRNPHTEAPVVRRPETTPTRKPEIKLTTAHSKKPEITTKKPTEAPTTERPETPVTKKPTTASTASKRAPTPISITIMKRANSTEVTTVGTTRPPMVPITERIPTTKMPMREKTTSVPKITEVPVSTTKHDKLNVAKITEIPTASKLQQRPAPAKTAVSKPEKVQAARPPTASVVLKPDKIITERPLPVTFEKVPISFSRLPSTASRITAEPSTTAILPEITTAILPEVTTTPAPISSTTKRTRRPSNKKKNKNRRRRPAKPTTTAPIDGVEHKEGSSDVTALTKPAKPLSTRIYNFIARDVMPNFGMGVMGLLGTAVLAGLLLLPIDGFARRSDNFKREEEQEGILPSIIQAVMTSLNIGERRYGSEEQGPRRLRRQTDSFNEVNTGAVSVGEGVDAIDQPFSIVRLMKQMLAIKLDVVAGMLRVASTALQNYAQYAETQRPSTTPLQEDESSTEKVELLEPASTQETPPPTPEVVTEQPEAPITTLNPEDQDESINLVRRRTHL